MTYIKINEILYPATIRGYLNDGTWDNRASKAITLEMEYALAAELFIDGATWFIVEDAVKRYTEIDDEGNIIEKTETYQNEYDNSAYNVAGDIVDHRDGTLTIKMGKQTDLEEAYELLYGGI